MRIEWIRLVATLAIEICDDMRDGKLRFTQ